MKNYAFYIVFFAALLSSTSGLFVKYMQIPATSMAWIRTATPALVIGLYFLISKRQIIRAKYMTMLSGSVINAFRMVFFFTTLIYTSISNAIIVFYTWPLFAVILSIIILKEKVSRQELIVLFLSFLGVLIVYMEHDFSFADKDFVGLTTGVITAFLYSCTIIFFKKGSDVYDPWETIFYQNIVGALFFLPFIITNAPVPSSLDWTLGIGHGVTIGLVMFFMFFYGLRHLPASRASMITYVEVIGGMLLGYFVLHEKITTSMVIGASIIMSGSIYLRQIKITTSGSE